MRNVVRAAGAYLGCAVGLLVFFGGGFIGLNLNYRLSQYVSVASLAAGVFAMFVILRAFQRHAMREEVLAALLRASPGGSVWLSGQEVGRECDRELIGTEGVSDVLESLVAKGLIERRYIGYRQYRWLSERDYNRVKERESRRRYT